MKKQTRLLIILAILLISLSSAPLASAKDGGRDGDKSDKSKVEIKIKNEENEVENEVEAQQEGIEVENNKFEIRGTISAIAGNNFMVAGQTIFLDPAQVNEFEQKGILAVGKTIKVEGIIKNGVKFAREINVLGEGQGRFKFEIKDSPLPALLTPSASPSATPQATVSANTQVKVKANGTIDQVSAFLQQILNFLKSLI